MVIKLSYKYTTLNLNTGINVCDILPATKIEINSLHGQAFTFLGMIPVKNDDDTFLHFIIIDVNKYQEQQGHNDNSQRVTYHLVRSREYISYIRKHKLNKINGKIVLPQ